jgi:hypothetical protein
VSDLTNERDLLKAASSATAECLDIAELGRYTERAGDAAWLERTTAHVNTCGHCQAELKLFGEWQSPEVSQEEKTTVEWISEKIGADLHSVMGIGVEPVSERKVASAVAVAPKRKTSFFSRNIFRLAFAAAAVLIVASAGFYFWNARGTGEPALISGVGLGGDTVRSGKLETRAPKGDVASVPATLSWQRVTGAGRYEVRLLEVDENVIWVGESSSPEVMIPANIRARIVPAKTLYWEVAAFDVAGTKLASSERQKFRLIPGASDAVR